MQCYSRRASVTDDFDIDPTYTAGSAGTESFHDRLLGGKARCKVRYIITLTAKGSLLLGEDAV
jgi:hypothetical protein